MANLRERDHAAAAMVAAWRACPWPGGRGRYYAKEKLRGLLGTAPRPMKTAAGWLELALEGDPLQERLYFSGEHDEPDVARFFAEEKAALAGATVFDVGGHVGYWALHLATTVGPRGRVVVFEPQPELADAIAHAAAWNRRGWLNVERRAVAEKPGRLELRRPADRGRASLAAVADADQSLEVETTTLDTYCQATGLWPTLVKIDIEGAEWLALQGARDLLARQPRLLIEIHPRQIAALGGDQHRLVDRLRAAGYQHLERLTAEGREPLPDPLPISSAWHLLVT